MPVVLAAGGAYGWIAARDRGACVIAARPVVAGLRRGRRDRGGDQSRGGDDDGEAETKCPHWPAQSYPATPRRNKAPFTPMRHKIFALIR